MAAYNIGSRSNNGTTNNSNTPDNMSTGVATPLNNTSDNKKTQKTLSDLLSIIKELNDQGANLSQLAPKNIGEFVKNLRKFTSTLGEIQNTINATSKLIEVISKINMSESQIENTKRVLSGLIGFNKEISNNLIPNIIDFQKSKISSKEITKANNILKNISTFNKEIIEGFLTSVSNMDVEKISSIISSYSKLPGLIKTMVADSYALILLLSGEESDLGNSPDKETKGLKGFFKSWYIKVFKRRLQRKTINQLLMILLTLC